MDPDQELAKERHRNLTIWKEAMALVNDIYTTTNTFPKDEVWGLTSQIRRAGVSIASNIAEGSKRPGGVRFESVAMFRRWHCHMQSATDSIYRRPAPIGLVSLHFDYPFVRGDKSNRSHLCRMFCKYAIPDT